MVKNDSIFNILCGLIKKQNLDEIDKLIKENPLIINVSGHSGNTLLHYAVKSNNYEIVKLLISYGENVNVINNNNNSLLHFACYNQNTEIAQLLLQSGFYIDIDLKNKHNDTALFYAYADPVKHYTYSINFDLIKLLIDNHADFNMLDKYNNTVFLAICYHTQYDNNLNSNIKHIKYLAERGANIQCNGISGLILLFTNTYNLSYTNSIVFLDIIKYLIEHGADPNIKNSKKKTLLTMANKQKFLNHCYLPVGHKYDDFINCLIKYGAK
jgi:ankyrin repeat protein